MITKYLFIDDETGSVTNALLDGFNDKEIVHIIPLELNKGESFEVVCKRTKEEVSNYQYDGVLIDLCLDGSGANSLLFKAQPFVQQIRSWASEGVIPNIPVVLCSTIENFDVYKKDSASHDLFDYYINKTEANFEEESMRMKALADGYHILNGNHVDANNFLGRTDLGKIDDTIIDYLKGASAFDVAQRIIKEVIPYPGLLIDQDTVAARMGIFKNEGKGWGKLREAISNRAMYKGVFASGWERYWSDKVNDFFMSLSEGIPYQVLNAAERVEILEKAGYDGLETAKPVKMNKSSYFDTSCCYSHRPLDSMEGIPVEDSMSLMPWQENHYVSFYYTAKGDFKEENLCQEGIRKFQEFIQTSKNE